MAAEELEALAAAVQAGVGVEVGVDAVAPAAVVLTAAPISVPARC